MSKHSTALFTLLRAQKKRATPSALIASWAAKETRDDLRELFTILAEHDPGAASAGDFSFWDNCVGGRVPAPDGDDDRSDVVCIGVTGGGDHFVVAAPGTSSSSEVTQILHDEDWSDGDSWSDLDSFIEARVDSYHEMMRDEFPDDEDEWKTDLDDLLA